MREFMASMRQSKALVRLLVMSCALYGTSALGADADICSAGHPPKPPARDLPSDADRARLRECNSMSLYYGLGVPVNFADARRCAIMELEAEEFGWPFQGAGMLMTIYFNGDGVPRNRKLAEQYACAMRSKGDAQPLLDQLDAAAAAGKRIEGCDAADDFNAFNACDMLQEDLKRHAARKQELDLVAHWDAVRRGAFAALKRASDAYIAARKPMDSVKMRGGSAEFYYEALFESEFVEVLKVFDDRGAAANDLVERDHELNAAYRKLHKLLSSEDPSDDSSDATLPTSRLREAERRWLDYAAACEAFRVATNAPVSADALRRMLVVQRTKALRSILEAHGDVP